MRGRAASQSPIERVTCAGSGACVGSGATLLAGGHARDAYPRVDVSLMESGLEHQRAAARAEPMADVGAPPPPFPGAGSFRKATVAFGAAVGQLGLERRHRLLFLHDPPLAVKLALEPPHLVGVRVVGLWLRLGLGLYRHLPHLARVWLGLGLVLARIAAAAHLGG